MKSILITGGNGYLGSWITDFFVEKNFEVTVLSRSIPKFQKPNVHYICADVTSLDDIKLSLGKYQFDYCIHAASANESNVTNYFYHSLMVNTLGTKNILEALKENKSLRFIYLSTFHVYGKQIGIIDEETVPTPINDYATTHLFAEYYVKQYIQFQPIIFRLTNGYGAPKELNSSKWYLSLNEMVKSAHENSTINLKSNGKQKRDFIWIQDICNILYSSLENKLTSGTYNLSSKNTLSIIELAQKVKNYYSTNFGIEIIIKTNIADHTSSNDLVVENKKLIEQLPYSFKNNIDTEIGKIIDLLENK